MNYKTTYYIDLRKMKEFGSGLGIKLYKEHKEANPDSHVTEGNFIDRMKSQGWSLYDAIHTPKKKTGTKGNYGYKKILDKINKKLGVQISYNSFYVHAKKGRSEYKLIKYYTDKFKK